LRQLVSVVTPAYNAGDKIGHSLRSPWGEIMHIRMPVYKKKPVTGFSRASCGEGQNICCTPL
jgi:hypothetical protein